MPPRMTVFGVLIARVFLRLLANERRCFLKLMFLRAMGISLARFRRSGRSSFDLPGWLLAGQCVPVPLVAGGSYSAARWVPSSILIKRVLLTPLACVSYCLVIRTLQILLQVPDVGPELPQALFEAYLEEPRLG